ncbi:MAG: tRNA dihydrouridine synthase DusB [Candidatus Pacearchaeota archaeon]
MAKSFPKLKSKLILAPMADITNIAFRVLCKKYGAALVSTELLSANAIAKKNKAVMRLALTDKTEKPNVLQLFSQNTESLVKAAKLMEDKFDIIDLNLGCPSKKIMEQGSGGALLKRKNKVAEIVKELSTIEKPFTVKIRSGFDKKTINAVEIAKICEPFVCAITVHARTVEQGYSGKADWEIIKQVKENVSIPVIGNGDVISGETAKQMLDETNCDYIMVGRGAIGNPFIFRQINEYLKTGKIISQTKQEKINDYFEYIDLAKKFNVFSLVDAKKKAQEFTKGLEGSAKLRRKLNSVKSYEEIEELMREMMK